MRTILPLLVMSGYTVSYGGHGESAYQFYVVEQQDHGLFHTKVTQINWTGGWGLCVSLRNHSGKPQRLEADHISLISKEKGMEPVEVPMPFQGVVPSEGVVTCIIPLQDEKLPEGKYPLELLFIKNGKEVELALAYPEFSSPHVAYDRNKVFKESGKMDSNNYLDAVCIAEQKGEDLLLNMSVRNNSSKPFRTNQLYVESPGYLKLREEDRKRSRLDRFCVSVISGDKVAEKRYVPVPVDITLNAGEAFEMVVLVKNMKKPEKPDRIEVTHLSIPEGLPFNSFPANQAQIKVTMQD